MKNLIVPGSLKILQSRPIVIYYALFNNFFYSQLASFLFVRKVFITLMMILKNFFFLSTVIFWYLSQGFFSFTYFFFRESLIFFTCFFLESFVAFLIKFICHFYVKNIRNVLLVFYGLSKSCRLYELCKLYEYVINHLNSLKCFRCFRYKN